MRYAALVAVALLSGAVGFLLGRGAPFEERATRPPAPPRAERAAIEVEPEAYAEMQEAVRRAERAAEEERRAIAEAPAGAEAASGRRPDGTIPGGARWSPQTRTLALGFLGGRVEEFFAAANLSDEQRARLRTELERRVSEVMQATADYVNGDIDGDRVYETLEAVAADGRRAVAQVLDERQIAVYQRFETGISDFVHTNVVANELANLRQELGLDREQERTVRPLVEERYRRVQQRLSAPIPNMLFKPVRRARDADIYDETGRAIRELLRPEQVAAFDAAERRASSPFAEFRSLLVPKGE